MSDRKYASLTYFTESVANASTAFLSQVYLEYCRRLCKLWCELHKVINFKTGTKCNHWSTSQPHNIIWPWRPATKITLY